MFVIKTLFNNTHSFFVLYIYKKNISFDSKPYIHTYNKHTFSYIFNIIIYTIYYIGLNFGRCEFLCVLLGQENEHSKGERVN